MFAPYPHGETVTVLTQGVIGVDPETNNDIYGTTATTAVDGCAVAPRTEDEVTENGRMGAVIGFNVYMPTGTAITANDLAVVRGDTCRVDGFPHDWRNPYTGRRPGLAVALTRVEG